MQCAMRPVWGISRAPCIPSSCLCVGNQGGVLLLGELIDIPTRGYEARHFAERQGRSTGQHNKEQTSEFALDYVNLLSWCSLVKSTESPTRNLGGQPQTQHWPSWSKLSGNHGSSL